MSATDFSLTFPEPNLITHIGVNHLDLAETAWLEMQITSAERADINTRYQRGLDWFATHTKSDPRWTRALDIREQLGWQRWSVERRCWTACKQCYAALERVPMVARLDVWVTHMDVPASALPLRSPHAYWRLVCGDSDPPGAWPPDPSEWQLDFRTAPLPAWMYDDLAAELAERTAS